ncbi:MAG: ATP-binding cassette domain-containing protein [Rhodospirillaceae bacterium]|nr:ATP-binding cassette domain-containing protein [Rhodospirillaceae bacterium]
MPDHLPPVPPPTAPAVPPHGRRPDDAELIRDPLVEVQGLAKYFDVSKPFLNRVFEGAPRRLLRAVDGVDIKIPRGETFSLVGESGCGKSTVARTIVGLYRPSRGTVMFEGTDLATLTRRAARMPFHRRVQMIFQDPFASLNPRWRVLDIIAEPIRAHRLAKSAQEVRERVAELLTQVKLTARDGEKFPHEFSGGQRQRISIARALASNPDFLVCDEPTSALDVSVQAQILNLMKDLQRELGLTYLFISHNLAAVYHVSDWVGVMYLGRVVEWGAKRTVFSTPRHPYTRMLLDTIPDITMSGRERMPVGGEVPNPIDPPPGCPFHPRCPHANERCVAELPASKVSEQGSHVACHGVEEGRIPTHAAPGAKVGLGKG